MTLVHQIAFDLPQIRPVPGSCQARSLGRRRACAHRVCAAALADPVATSVQTLVSKVTGAEGARQVILDAVSGVKGRGKSGISPEALEGLQEAVQVLEDNGGVQAPTNSKLLEGRWRLLFTTRPGSASPIQRTFTGVDAFTVYQEILFSTPAGARVNNIVDFGGRIGQLKVEAEANTVSRPLPGFTPRKGKGLPLFGKSESTPPSSPDVRIDFQFDQAAFDLAALPFKIPYPVPFKLLGDETKGWLDITYLSPDGQFRLSRGNKGTLFVLVRDPSPRERLLQAVERGQSDEVQAAIQVLQDQGSAIAKPARSAQVFGRWRLRWSKQAGCLLLRNIDQHCSGTLAKLMAHMRFKGYQLQSGASPSLRPLSSWERLNCNCINIRLLLGHESALKLLQECNSKTGLTATVPAACAAVDNQSWQSEDAPFVQKLGENSGRSWQSIRQDGTLENRSVIIPGLLTLRADATCEAASADRTAVDISIVYIDLGPFKLPFKLPRRDDRPPAYVDWLYLDDNLRITQGSRGSLFVHTREELE